jgi:hypothetical protein
MNEKIDKILLKLAVVLGYVLSWIVIVLTWAVYIALHISMFVIPYMIVIFPLLVLIIKIVVKVNHMRLLYYLRANTILHGARGSGKGLIFQYAINKEAKAMCNMDYGKNVDVVPPSIYFNSIAPNNTNDFLKTRVIKIKKNNRYEKVPYYLDDGIVYFPNYEDNYLKLVYKPISLQQPINRHLYDTFTIVNVQSIDRLYKVLRELQMDGYIKALRTYGKGYILKRLPVIRKYLIVKWRYHENLESAINNRLPFSKMGLVNKTTSSLYTTQASAMKEVYDGENGLILDGIMFIKRKHIYYNTRYFHDVFFEEPLLKT